MTNLPADHAQQVRAALERLGATRSCPRCGGEHFNVVDGYLLGHLQTQLRNVVLSRENRFPMVAVTCANCGFVAHHTLFAIQADKRPGYYT